MLGTATALAHPNIAFIKYWGNRDDALRLPSNGSISMNLDGLHTITTVLFTDEIDQDRFVLNGVPQTGDKLQRVSMHLDQLRHLAAANLRAQVISENNFPTGTGIASSASAFAALTVSAAAALDLSVSEATLSALARLGSGSASRSVPDGYVEWFEGDDSATSFATTIAPQDYWGLADVIAVVSSEHKAVGSTGGHSLAATSPLQTARVLDTHRRLAVCREAILNRDFEAFASIVELDALMMHSVMMTSRPPLLYWLPPTLRIMQEVMEWRAGGLPVCWTIDAGPNVHVITPMDRADEVRRKIAEIDGVEQVLTAGEGGPTTLLDRHLSA